MHMWPEFWHDPGAVTDSPWAVEAHAYTPPVSGVCSRNRRLLLCREVPTPPC